MQATIDRGFEMHGESSSLRGILRHLWQERDLIRILARKDFFVKYRRASLGVFWAVGLPLIQATVLSIVLTRIVRFKTPIPFPVFVYSGILPWSFFSSAVTSGTTSITDGASLATKIYFPRSILTIVNVLSGFYAFIPGVGILMLMTALFTRHVGPSLLLLAPAVLLMLWLSLAFTLVLSALQVYFRDMRHIMAAIILPWFWGSGVFYPLDRLGHHLRAIVDKNPAAGMIQLFRAAVGGESTHWQRPVLWAVVWGAVLLVAAALLHRRYDRVFVDLL